MESMRKDSHFALVLSVFQEELCLVKKPVAGTVWGRGGLVNSWGFIEWERDPCKKNHSGYHSSPGLWVLWSKKLS